MNFDPYEVLGVSKTADIEDIKKQYRKLVKETHPDVNPGNPEAEAKFKQISQAWEILSDPQKRQEHDMQGSFFTGRSVFENFFRNFGPFGGPTPGGFATPEDLPKPERLQGSNVSYALEVSPLEILLGDTISRTFSRLVPCQECGGKGADFVKCDSCDGKGLLFQSTRQGHFISQTAKSCPRCIGFGWKKENACSTCGGTGLIPKEQEVSISLEGIAGPVPQLTKIMPGQGNYGGHGGPPGDLILTLTVTFPDRAKITDEIKELLLNVKHKLN